MKKIIIILAFVLITISSASYFIFTQNNSSEPSEEDAENTRYIPESYPESSTPHSTPSYPSNEDILLLADEIYEASVFTQLDECIVEYSNPNFENFSFEYNSCEWEVSNEQELPQGLAVIFNFDLNLKHIKTNKTLSFSFIIPAGMGWVSTTCYTNEKVVSKITSSITRLASTYTDHTTGDEINNMVYYSNIIFSDDEKFKSVTDVDNIDVYELEEPIINPNAEKAIDLGVKYCMSPGPAFETKISEKFQNSETYSHGNAKVMLSIVGESHNEEFSLAADEVVKTMVWE